MRTVRVRRLKLGHKLAQIITNILELDWTKIIEKEIPIQHAVN